MKETRVKAYIMEIPKVRPRIPSDILNIVCVLKGSAVVSDSFSDTLLQKDDTYVVNPNFPFYFHDTGADEPCLLMSIELDLNHYRAFFPDITTDFYFTCRIDPDNRMQLEYVSHLRTLMAKLYFLCTDPEDVKSAYDETDIYARRLISFLLDHFQHYIYKTDEEGNLQILLNTESPTPYDPERIYRIIDYIYDHSREKLRLSDIASVEYLSTWYLSRYIKETSGLPFGDHLSMARCEEAEGLLLTTNKTIDTIAQEVGFSNRQHFSAQFRRWFRTSPSDYRKRYIESMTTKMEDTSVVVTEDVLHVIQSYLS